MLFAIGACSKISSPDEPDEFHISGSVTEEITSEPVANQTVWLWDYQQEIEFSTQTSQYGNYSFDELVQGNYLVSCKETEDYSFSPDEEYVELSNEDITGIDFVRHNRKHNISGRVVDEITNDPVIDQTVWLWDYQEEVEFSTQTSQYGNYSFDELVQGNYLVSCKETEDYSFSPDEEYVELSNEDITGIDFVRHISQAIYSISGRVSEEITDNPVIDQTVWLWDHEQGIESSAQTNDSGEYSFDKLLYGNYVVYCNEAEYYFIPPEQDIEIIDESITGVDFVRYGQ